MCCWGSERGVNRFSEGCTVFVCLIRLSCLSWWLRGKHRDPNRAPALINPSAFTPVLCVQTHRHHAAVFCHIQCAFDAGLSFRHSCFLCAIAIFTSHTHTTTTNTTTFSLHEWFRLRAWLKATQVREYYRLHAGSNIFIIASIATPDRMLFCGTHLCLCPLPLRFTSCDRHGFTCLCCSSLPLPSRLSPPPQTPQAQHTHELEQLPWQWPSVVIIYSLSLFSPTPADDISVTQE